MHNLHKLIEQYGPPDSLIDHWDSSSNRFAVWGFEEEFFIDNTGRSFRNGNKINGAPLDTWQDTLDYWKSDKMELATVGFISYDLKNLLFQ